jgi:hypothetical protein
MDIHALRVGEAAGIGGSRIACASGQLVIATLEIHEWSDPRRLLKVDGATVLFCSVLFCSVLFCSVLFCSVLFCDFDSNRRI